MLSTRAGAWWAVLALGAGMAALWAASQPAPPAPRRTGPITVDATPVPLNAADPAAIAIGAFRYAGGLALRSSDTDRLHGLSDLEVTGADRLVAVSDFGAVFEARLMFDRESRVVGMADAHISQLAGTDGQPLVDKADADAEGLAVLPSGDRLVSFELRDRIWLYPAGGGPPMPVPAPSFPFAFNAGMEALASDPDTGPDAYIVGVEDAGATWTCRQSQPACVGGPAVEKSAEFGLVAIRRLPAGRLAYLLRAFDVLRGNRISLVIVRAAEVVARMDIASPQTVDNFEGLAAVPRTDGGVRFYLLSDDNGAARQRTLLLAFDWAPR